MGFRRLTCACALALVACGDNQETRTTSGSRLKLYWYSFDDGPRQLADGDLWDEKRQEACRPAKWSDGNTYCTPAAHYLIPYYTTPDCTSAVYLIETVERPSYVARYTSTGEDAFVETLAHPLAELLDQYWAKEGDECTGPIDGTLRSFYGPGEGVSRSDLVRLRVRESTGEGRVAVRALTSDDGFYLPLDFEDRELHSPCVLYPGSGGDAWCVPESPYDVQYRDAACTKPVLVAGDNDDEVPSAVVLGTTCAPRAYAVVGETAQAPAYTQNGDACVESTQGGSPWFDLLEHPVATVPRRRVSTGERLEPIVMDVDGTSVAARQLFDTEAGVECTRAVESNSGLYRCVPRDVGFVVDGFSDASCTVPIEVALVYIDASRIVCNGEATPRYARDFGSTTIIRELLGPRAAPVYTRDNAGCRVDASNGYRIYDLGPPVPNERWARALPAAHD